MEKSEHPIQLFQKWYDEELSLTKVSIPSAVCLSTIGKDGFPNARFVSLKEIIDDSFIVTGPLNSRKGEEVKNNNRVSLTFWWTETERQIRIQGLATQISDAMADKYFDERDKTSQVISLICEQGKELEDLESLEKRVMEKAADDQKVRRPQDWSGFMIKPVRIEFMEFKTSRFHLRRLYEVENSIWKARNLQP